MTQKFFFIGCFFLLGIAQGNSQANLDCKTKLSLFHPSVVAQKYDEAFENWKFVFENCPDLNLAIYADGEKMLKHKIKTIEGNTKVNFIELLLTVWDKRQQYYASQTPIGEYEAKACQLLYDHKDIVGTAQLKLYSCFDNAFTKDQKTFRNPKNLYTYFSLVSKLHDNGEKSDAELFDTYDDVVGKIAVEVENYSEKLNMLISKTEQGETLSKRDERKKSAYESYLKAYALIQENIDKIADRKANCQNLVPLYTKYFNTKQNDSVWLKRSVSRLYHKECTSDELYEKLVKHYDKVAPSADTKVFVATVLLENGKDEEAYKYLEEAFKLEKRPYKKANLAIRIGVIYKNKGRYATARAYLLEALKLNPSNGRPHILIAEMYKKSAKNKSCGKDNFFQRAVYWLAIDEVKKASRLDPTLQKIVQQYADSYASKAPTKVEIFNRDMSAKRIDINCWINRYTKVPKLD